MAGNVGSYQPLPVPPRPTYDFGINVDAGRPASMAQRQPRLQVIYLNDVLARSLIEQIAGAPEGVLKTNLAVHAGGVLAPHNVWAVVADLRGVDSNASAVDLSTQMPVRVPEDLYPSQALTLTGSIGPTRSITPTGFNLILGDVEMRVLVDRQQGLHLNQSYLAGREVVVVGSVQSVVRSKVRASAIATVALGQSGAHQ